MQTAPPIKIAILVHGRFHMFDLAKALLESGIEIYLFTNYPAWAVKKFGLSSPKVFTHPWHGYLTRVIPYLIGEKASKSLEKTFHQSFGTWAKGALTRHQPTGGWDAILGMSGISEEAFQHFANSHTLCILHRLSTHIREQREILDQEEKRTGKYVEKPSSWIIDREEREYQKADVIRVTSPFALNGFLKQGLPTEKVKFIPLGVNRSSFEATKEQKEERLKRVRSGAPLRVLGVGTFCLRKGAYDLEKVIHSTAKENLTFRFVGKVGRDALDISQALKDRVEFLPKVPQDRLHHEYAWGDLFLLPSLEDGFAVVVTQAMSCGLPIIVSENTGANYFVKEGTNGWVVPIRSPEEMGKLLRELNQNREYLANIIENCQETIKPWTWSDVARETIQDLEEQTRLKKNKALLPAT